MLHTVVNAAIILVLTAFSSALATRLDAVDGDAVISNLSPAERLVSEASGACKPLLARSACADAEYRGVVLAFHGFSACTHQLQELAGPLQKTCVDVVAPVLPGHGEAMVDCASEPRRCTVQMADGRGFDLRELPTDGTPYSQFAVEMAKVAEDELEFRTAQLGLPPGGARLFAFGISLGSALAFRALVSRPELYERQLLLNPFFVAGSEHIDVGLGDCLSSERRGERSEQDCANAARELWIKEIGAGAVMSIVLRGLFGGDTAGGVESNVLSYIYRLQKYVPAILIGSFRDTTVTWGDSCPNILQRGRGGFCMFQQKHLLAINEFGRDVLSTKLTGKHWWDDNIFGFGGRAQPPITQVVATERDGITRNGISYSFASRLHGLTHFGSRIAMCMYPFRAGTDVHNGGQYWDQANSLPHDPLGSGSGWWEPKLSQNIVSFLAGETDNFGEVPWARERSKCVALPLHSQALVETPWVQALVLPQADPEWSVATGGASDPTTTTTTPASTTSSSTPTTTASTSPILPSPPETTTSTDATTSKAPYHVVNPHTNYGLLSLGAALVVIFLGLVLLACYQRCRAD